MKIDFPSRLIIAGTTTGKTRLCRDHPDKFIDLEPCLLQILPDLLGSRVLNSAITDEVAHKLAELILPLMTDRMILISAWWDGLLFKYIFKEDFISNKLPLIIWINSAAEMFSRSVSREEEMNQFPFTLAECVKNDDEFVHFALTRFQSVIRLLPNQFLSDILLGGDSLPKPNINASSHVPNVVSASNLSSQISDISSSEFSADALTAN